MIAVTFALILLNLATVAAGARLLSRQRREHSRREDMLLARICHLADRPWEPAPADTWQAEDEPDDKPVLIANPEQWVV